jgi:transposase InsO family protein
MISQIYHVNKGRYGYRRITLELRNLGYIINHKTVYRLMGHLKLKSLVRIKKYRAYRGQRGGILPNLLQRDFKANVPCKKWVTDISEFSLLGQKVYLSALLDLYNGEVISYSYDIRPNYALVDVMLQKALPRVPEYTTLIIHSDQGWHYQMKTYQHTLKMRGIRQSMSRKGNCLDNAVMESFFGLLKTEFFYLSKFDTLEQFIRELDSYIHYYNTVRIKAKLKGLSPVQYRIQSSDVA